LIVAVFAALLAPCGLPFALAAPVAVAQMLGLGTLKWMRWRGRLAIIGRMVS